MSVAVVGQREVGRCEVTTEEAQLLMLKGHLAGMDADIQTEVRECAEALRVALVAASPTTKLLALGVVGLEIQIEVRRNDP